MEIWKPIKGYETFYMISNHGNIKSLDRSVARKNRGTLSIQGKPLTKQLNGNGYHKVQLWRDNQGRQILAHRLVAEHFLPPPKEGQTDVNHINSIRTDNHIDNLEWATRSENMRHGVKYGFCNSKNDNWNPDKNPKLLAKTNPNKAKKLTKEAVEDMRDLRKQGWTYKAIGIKYNVSRQMVSFVCRGKSWR